MDSSFTMRERRCLVAIVVWHYLEEMREGTRPGAFGRDDFLVRAAPAARVFRLYDLIHSLHFTIVIVTPQYLEESLKGVDISERTTALAHFTPNALDVQLLPTWRR